MKKEKQGANIVRSSAAEYLTFITATGKSDVNAVYFDENVWLDENSVIRKFRITAADGKNYNTNVSAKIAEQHALSEFEKYRVRQDRLYQSDFDRVLLGETETRGITDDESLTNASNSELEKGGEDA